MEIGLLKWWLVLGLLWGKLERELIGWSLLWGSICNCPAVLQSHKEKGVLQTNSVSRKSQSPVLSRGGLICSGGCGLLVGMVWTHLPHLRGRKLHSNCMPSLAIHPQVSERRQIHTSFSEMSVWTSKLKSS